jgi:hypothetical protein
MVCFILGLDRAKTAMQKIKTQEYKWVQVLTAILSDGRVIQLVRTTDSDKMKYGIDELMAIYHRAVGEADVKKAFFTFTDSSGLTQREKLVPLRDDSRPWNDTRELANAGVEAEGVDPWT